jgi:hypothetical protein
MDVKKGDRLQNEKGLKGTVVHELNGECIIHWDNGHTDAMKNAYLESNYIKKVDA